MALSLTGLVVFRYIYIRYNKNIWTYFSGGPYGDAATYFFLIQFFRKHNCGVSDERCLLSNEPVLVPSIYMKIVGKLFSDNTLLKRSWLPNFFLYVLASLFFLLMLIIHGDINKWLMAFMVIFFVIQPDNISLDKHRVHYTVLQPRYFGLLLNSVFWFLYVSYGITVWSFVLMVLLAFLSLNTSIFCRQMTFFSIVLASILLLDGLLFLILPVSALMSAILFPKEFIPSIKPQIQYSYQYYLNYYKPKPSRNLLIHFLKNIISRPVYESYPYFASILMTCLLSYILFNIPKNNNAEYQLLRRLSFTYLSVIIIFIITGIRRYAFLGECWRYISYSFYFLTPFFLPLLINQLPIPEMVKEGLILMLILAAIAIASFAHKEKLGNKTPALIDLLNNGPESFRKSVWYGVPYRVSTTAVALGYGTKTFEYQYGNHSNEIHNTYFASYPYLKWNKTILSDNNVTHVLVENELLSKAQEISNFSTKELKLIITNSEFSIYEIL